MFLFFFSDVPIRSGTFWIDLLSNFLHPLSIQNCNYPPMLARATNRIAHFQASSSFPLPPRASFLNKFSFPRIEDETLLSMLPLLSYLIWLSNEQPKGRRPKERAKKSDSQSSTSQRFERTTHLHFYRSASRSAGFALALNTVSIFTLRKRFLSFSRSKRSHHVQRRHYFPLYLIP